MRNILRKGISVLLALSMLFTVVAGLGVSAYAQGQTTVQIVSFVRGAVNDLRSSELLEARVENYDGNISDLTFIWENNVYTYLYIYNSSNMYNIKDTAGEIELYGGKTVTTWEDWKLVTTYVPGETVSAKGYAWAAVYGAQLGTNSLNGEISVTVKDPKGNVIGSATYEGPFKKPSLKEDLVSAKYGVFENETIDVKDMLGRSSIVHIDCAQCKVSGANVVAGYEEFIDLNGSNGSYSVKGLKSGTGKINLTLRKDNCKFHQYSNNETITNTVYVFKKPNTSTTTTTLTLTNIDDKCDYFIGSNAGVESADGKTVVFEGLTPDTTYEVTVRGNYGDGYAYAYVSDTTKPAFKATVNCYTNDVLADFLTYYQASDNLFIKEVGADSYISLNHETKGVYSAGVDNGIYYIYYKDGNSYKRVGDYQLTIDNNNSFVDIYTYSLEYDTNGGKELKSMGGVYYIGTSVYATTEIPQKDDHSFLYWVDTNGITYKPGQLVEAAINAPIVLKAMWAEAIDIKVNITIDHKSEDGGYDVSTERDDVTFRLVEVKGDTYVPVSNDVELGKVNVSGYNCVYDDVNKTSKYTSTEVNFKGAENVDYSISCTKSGYELVSISEAVEGNTRTFDVELKYEPKNFDLKFDVVMNGDVPKEYYPAGVNVKVLFWGTIGEETTPQWRQLTQQNGLLYVGIDENGKGSSTYPVWRAWTESEKGPYYYSIEVVSYVLKDGSVVTDAANAFSNIVTIENGGGIPAYPAGSNVRGAFYGANGQDGVPTAKISINSYKLTFDANGGTINGKATDVYEKQLIIPDLLKFVPSREGGYTFDGWYEDSACKNPAKSGTKLTEDTTLYAKWIDPLSVDGTVKVEAFYKQDNETVEVLEVDRAENIVITLQVERNGQYNDIMSVVKELVYDSNDVATVSYAFPEIPATKDAGYRIKTALINYRTLYNNNGGSDYSENENTVIFNSNRGTVDAWLKFEADQFEQRFVIDATKIGEGYRPANGVTQVLFQTKGTTPPNTVISQHNVAPYGEYFTFGNNGKAEGGLQLWKGISNGAISNYQLSITRFDNEEYDDALPYTVRYGNSTSWDASSGSAGVLEAALVPKDYIVTFDLGTEDKVGNMDDYLSMSGDSYFTLHKWSYDTPITAMPTREGYVFVGWTTSDEGAFDGQNVDASVAKDITLTANWVEFKWVTATDTGYFVNAEENKEAVVRFLFDVETTGDFEKTFTQTGIKFIKSTDIAETVGADLTRGSLSTFYGDITKIPESNADTTYYAIAYVVCNNQTYWSSPVECKPSFSNLIIYERGANDEEIY